MDDKDSMDSILRLAHLLAFSSDYAHSWGEMVVLLADYPTGVLSGIKSENQLVSRLLAPKPSTKVKKEG